MEHKKIFLFLVMGILLISMVSVVSAAKIDYTPNDKQVEDMKVIFSDTILFGLIKTGEQGTVELKSHETPRQILRVGTGEQVTMFYDFNFKDIYSNGLGDVKFIDMRTGNEIERDYSFVYWGTETREREVCLNYETITNLTNSSFYEVCNEYGTENYTYEGWLNYNSNDIPKGYLRIGLKTYVEARDYVDGIWTIQGKELAKHAEWVEDGVENYQNTVGGADISGATINLSNDVTNGFVKALGIVRGDGSTASQFQVHINQSDVNLATGIIDIDGTDSDIAYVNFTNLDYSNALNAGAFTIDLHRISGNILFQRGTGISYSGTLFSFTSQTIPTTSTGTTITFAQVTISSNLQITLNSPENDYNQTTTDPINFNVTVTDDLGIENVTLYIDGVVNETNSSGVNGTYIFTKTFPEGNYNWSILAFDNEDNSNQSATRTFSIDTLAPEITIESPISTYDYLYLDQLIDLNFTVTDASSHLDSCWWNYNGTNYSTACTNATLASTSFAQENSNFNITVYANDSFGNVGSSTQTWSTEFLETNRVYDASSLQTGTESFIWVSTKDSDVTGSSATLTYDGNTYLSTRTTSGYNVNFTNSIDIPVDLSGAIPFYWTVSFTNTTGSFSFNTSSTNQTVYNLTLTECFAPTPAGLTLNFTTYDSTNMTPINSKLEATFQFYAESGSGDLIQEFLFSDLNENRSNYMYCLESSGENVTVDAFISYGATDHDNREYIIDDGIIGNFTQTIPLYLTATELTDIVTITVQDQNYDPISGALVAVQRWNIGTNTYSTIGMLTTSSSGQGIMDLELYTTWYRAVVYVDGEIVEVTDVQKLSSTSWIITIELGVDNPYDLFGDISHGLTFDNETNITSFTWLDSSGYTSQGCLIVRNQTALGPIEIENECTSSVSGTIDYLLTGEGSFTAYGIIYLTGYNQSQIVDVLNIQLGTPEITQKVSPFGKVISFIAVGTATLIGVAAGSAILGGALVIAVLIVLMKIGFLNITWGFVWGIITIIIVIWFMQRRKR